MKNYSIIRSAEYKNVSKLNLDGDILDVGGSKKSGYHELVKGDHKFTVINIDEGYGTDFIVDIEKKFPFEDNKFDHAICLNVLEHIYEYQNAVAETVRVVKEGGKIVIAVPMIFHIHGSPDDYFRYTESALRRLLTNNGCEIEEVIPLGGGFFSLGAQCVAGAFPTDMIRMSFKHTAIFLDKFLNKISKKYRKLTGRIPLGYFVVAKKKSSN